MSDLFHEAFSLDETGTELLVKWLPSDFEAISYLSDQFLKDDYLHVTKLRLVGIYFSDQNGKAVEEFLAKSNTLKRLELFWPREISEAVFADILTGIKQSNSLIGLNFICIGVVQKMLERVLELLESSEGLMELGVESEDLERGSALKIGQAAIMHKHITRLNLRESGLCEADVEELCRVLMRESNHSLKCLDVSFNSIGGGGCKAFAKMLQGDCRLEELMLDHCALKDDETRCICEALQNNKKLKYLTLRENSLHPAEHVWCNMLQENSVLKTLALSNCYLSPEACFGLAQGLKSNKGLTSLCLNGCEVDDVGLLHLSDVLRVNSTLRSLRCYSRNCSNKGALSLAAAVSVNKVIESIMFPESDEDAEEEVAAWLLLNGSLTDCSGKFLAICERNFEMHQKAKQAVQALRLLRWKEGEGEKTVFHALPKGIVKIIGVLVWESRTEVETWAHSL